jgi:hypothetical protein
VLQLSHGHRLSCAFLFKKRKKEKQGCLSINQQWGVGRLLQHLGTWCHRRRRKKYVRVLCAAIFVSVEHGVPTLNGF